MGGLHGVAHWARVLENGRMLSPIVGARSEVVELFAVLHDCRRLDDGIDPDHGRRAAEYVRARGADFFGLAAGPFSLLVLACEEHVDGGVSEEATIQVCWDADRLDLGRVAIDVDPDYLGPYTTPDIIAWATRRARAGQIPDLVADEWGLVRGF